MNLTMKLYLTKENKNLALLKETKKFEIGTASVRETKKNKGKVKYWRKHSHPVPY